MSGPIGHTFIYNIIILFIIIVFAFLAGIMSYYKAFKVNNGIVNAIEKFEGYNDASKNEIDRILGNLGYSSKEAKCPDKYKEMGLSDNLNSDKRFQYCIYIDNEEPGAGEYYSYGVLTYMNIDLPIINLIEIPIFTKTNQIYKFSDTNNWTL